MLVSMKSKYALKALTAMAETRDRDALQIAELNIERRKGLKLFDYAIVIFLTILSIFSIDH